MSVCMCVKYKYYLFQVISIDVIDEMRRLCDNKPENFKIILIENQSLTILIFF